MYIEDIYEIEQQSNNCIHLFKFSMFWKAFETSAYLFSTNFRPYQVLAHYYKNIGQRIVYLGFPDSTLHTILDAATSKGFSCSKIDDTHYVIKNVKNLGYFHQWKAHHHVHVSTETERKEKAKLHTRHSEDYLFKCLYEFSVYVLNLVPKVDKRYKFTLSEPLATEIIDLCKEVYSVTNGILGLPLDKLKQKMYDIQIQVRLLASLHQISLKQLRYINQQIVSILEIMFPASESSRTSGGTTEESSILPAPM